MRRVNAVTVAATFAVGAVAGFGFAGSAQAPGVTAYEGARLIVGDGRVVENGTIVVDGEKIVQAGANVQVPAGARRVSLTGKTVMPMMIDTHTHLSATRDKLLTDLQQRAYW